MQMVNVPVGLRRVVIMQYFSLGVKITNSLIKRAEHKIEVGFSKLYQPLSPCSKSLTIAHCLYPILNYDVRQLEILYEVFVYFVQAFFLISKDIAVVVA